MLDVKISALQGLYHGFSTIEITFLPNSQKFLARLKRNLAHLLSTLRSPKSAKMRNIKYFENYFFEHFFIVKIVILVS